MGIIAGRIEPFIGGRDPDEPRDEPLGTRLRGRFAELDVDSVDTVREIRES
jgi:hypothetical protein